MGVILEPEVGEEALHYHHGDTDKEGVLVKIHFDNVC